MPTPESAAAFEKLVAARERLLEITSLLNEAHTQINKGRAERQRFLDLQEQWDALHKAYKMATEDFMGVIDHMKRPED
jgi:hypothetical protein